MRFVVLVFASLVACSVELELAPDSRVNCTSQADCFGERVCVVDIGSCLVVGTACIDRSGDTYRSVAAGTACNLDDGSQGVCVLGACEASSCGDGVYDEGREECDAGLANSDSNPDACRTDCKRPWCGDGVIDLGETCDDGDDNGEGQACSSSCTQFCGDGSRQPNEECDDGNPVSGDGCDPNCTTTACGNGIMSLEEDCDDGNLDDGDGCDSNCTATGCGNGIETAGEVCDDGNNDSGDDCRADCLSTEECGNALTDFEAGERCDLGELNSSAPDAQCRTDCSFARCGDGILDAGRGEACDGPSALGSGTCADFGFYTGALACNANCQYSTAGCSQRCGDDVVNGDEVCDGTPPAGESCLDYGFDLGRLGCSTFCAPSFARCGTYGFVNKNLSSDDNFYDVWMDSSGVAFAVGSFRIARYDGTQWSNIPTTGLSFGISGVWGTAPDNVFFVGSSGGIRRFNGTSHTAMTSGTSTSLSAVWGRSSSDVYAVGQGGVIVHYNGTSWSTMTGVAGILHLATVHGVQTAGQPVYAAGALNEAGNARAVILKYESGTWTTAYTGLFGREVNDLYVRAANDIWAVGNVGYLLHYDGVSWSDVSLNISRNFYAVYAAAADAVLAVGEAGIAYFYNGHVWIPIDSGTGRSLNGIAGRGPSDMILVGESGTRRHYDGIAWVSDETPVGFWGEIAGIWGTSSDDVWAGSTSGMLYHFDGSAWTRDETSYVDNFTGLFGNGSALYASGQMSPGNFAQGSGGGVVAESIPELAGCSFYETWASETGHVFLVGSNNTAKGCLAHYNGSSWSNFLTPDFMYLQSVFGFADDDVIAVGDTGKVARFDGDSWTLSNIGAYDGLLGVWGASPSEIFAVGGEGAIWFYDGALWTSMDSGTSEHLYAVWGTSATDVFAAGVGGTIVHYDGVDWALVKSPTAQNIKDIWGFDGKVVFFGVGGGLPLRLLYGGALEH